MIPSSSKPHVCYWSVEWTPPPPLFLSSKMEPRLLKLLDDFENQQADDFYKTLEVDWSVLPSTGTRTVRPKNYLLPNGKGL
jgi:hypothetical protein